MILQVLGRTAKERGDQLELLAKAALAATGFGSFVRNAHKAGAEVDLRARHRITSAPVLVECKAHARPIGARLVRLFFSEWVKERARDGRLTGIVISTSGFSGTALQWHTELAEDFQRNFLLLGPDEIADQLVQSRLIASEAHVRAVVSERAATVPPTEMVLTYSQYGFVWLSKFLMDDGALSFAMLDGSAGMLQSWESKEVIRLLGARFRAGQFFGLDVRRHIQLGLLRNGALSVQQLSERVGESLPDVEHAIRLLRQQHHLVGAPSRVELSGDIIVFVSLAREFLLSQDAEVFLSSAYTRSMLRSEPLLSYIEHRYRVGLGVEQRQTVAQLLSISATALYGALFDEPEKWLRTASQIHTMTNASEQENWLSFHASSFVQVLVFRAIHDLTGHRPDAAKHLADVGIKCYRIDAALTAVGAGWNDLVVSASKSVFLAKAGGTISAGSLVTHSDPAEVDMWTGLLCTASAHYVEAERAFRSAERRAHDSGDRGREEAALNNLALVYMRQNQFDDASRILDEAIANGRPQEIEPMTNKLICLMELGQHSEAESLVNSIVEHFPEGECSEAIQRYRNRWSRDSV